MKPGYKKCNNPKCDNPIKPVSEFFKDSSRKKDGLSPQCKDCKKKLNKKYIDDHAKENKEYHQQYFQDNKDHLMTLDKIWKDNNPDRTKEIQNEYTQRNLDRKVHHNALRRARLLQRTPKWADLDKIKEIYTESRAKTVLTGIQYSVDHDIPLNGKYVSGLHVETNLRVIPLSENRRKNATYEIDDIEDNLTDEEILEILLQEEDIV
jgi:hypothetical protein